MLYLGRIVKCIDNAFKCVPTTDNSKTSDVSNPEEAKVENGTKPIEQPCALSGTTQVPVVTPANTHYSGFSINNFIRPQHRVQQQPALQYNHSEHCTCGHHSNKNTKGTSKKPTPADPRPGVSLEDKSKELNLKVNLEYSHMIKRRVNEDQINTLLRVFDAKWLKKRLAESNFPLPNGNLPLFLEVNPAIYAQYASLHAEYAFDFAFITKNEAGKTFLLLICTEPEFDPAVNEYCDVSFIFVF